MAEPSDIEALILSEIAERLEQALQLISEPAAMDRLIEIARLAREVGLLAHTGDLLNSAAERAP